MFFFLFYFRSGSPVVVGSRWPLLIWWLIVRLTPWPPSPRSFIARPRTLFMIRQILRRRPPTAGRGRPQKKSVSQVTNHAALPPPPPPPSSSLSPCFSCLFSLSLSLSHSPNFISRFVVQFPEVDVTERGRFFFVDADYAKKGVGGGEEKTRTDKKHIEPESEKSSALVRASVIRSIYGIRTVLGVPRVPLAKHDSPIIPTRYHFSLMCPSMNERQLFVLGKFKSSKRSQVQRESSTFCFNLLSRFAGIIKIRLQKTVVAERFQTKI